MDGEEKRTGKPILSSKAPFVILGSPAREDTMNKRLAAAALALAAAGVAVPAAAQEPGGTLKRIRDSGSITIGHRESSIPFSFVDDKQQPIGYSMDICAAIVEEVKKELSLATLAVKFAAVTPQTRIQLMANNSIDLECGSTTNTLTRQKQVAFSPPVFISGTKLLAKKSSRVKSYRDLKGKTIVVTQGTTNERILKTLSEKENLGIRFFNARDHDEAFLTVESGRAVAFAMDDILLYGLIAKAKNPKDFEVVGDYLSYDPYGIMFRVNDDAFGVVVRRAIARLMGEPGQCNGAIRLIYKKWFTDKLPDGQPLGLPMSPLLEAVCKANALPD
jgi:glutamate/aspartate transport system substrate-binding protein